MVKYLRPSEIFRNAKSRPWAIGGTALLAVGGAIAAVFADSAGLAVAIVLIVFLLSVLVDVVAESEASEAERRAALVNDLVAKLSVQAPGVLATYSEPRDVPFVELLRKAASHEQSARRVQLVGWFFPYCIEGARFAAFREFFSRGGHVDIVVPDVSDRAVAASLAAMRSSDLDTTEAARRTCSSVKGLNRIRAEAGGAPEALRVFVRRTPINYAAYCFAGRDLILGPYEHAFDSSARAPRLHFDLAHAGSFAAFWRVEFHGMVEANDDIDITEWLDAVAKAHWSAPEPAAQSPGSSPPSPT